MLAIDSDEPLVADFSSEDFNFLLNLVHRQHPTLLRFIFAAEAAVGATVDTEVAHVERSKHHNSIVVDRLLNGQSGFGHLIQ